jgi:hypothetical protein
MHRLRLVKVQLYPHLLPPQEQQRRLLLSTVPPLHYAQQEVLLKGALSPLPKAFVLHQ